MAEGRYLSDELTIHYGLLPRTNRGIFAINELPDLAERIQVGLLNIMEERDVQIRGYKVRLPLDLFVVASANPEDYTNRGRIITPLKDRFGSQIRTHYPRRLEHEIAIMEAERTHFAADGLEIRSPEYMKQIVAELTHLARRSSEISQRSGVSVRVTHLQLREPALERAQARHPPGRGGRPRPRVSDLGALVASTSGQDRAGDGRRRRARTRSSASSMQRAVLNVFNRSFTGAELEEVVGAFQGGLRVEVSDVMSAGEYVRQLGEVRPLAAAVQEARRRGSRHRGLRPRVRPRGAAPQPQAQQGRAGRPHALSILSGGSRPRDERRAPASA